MSSTLNSPKISNSSNIPILRGSKFSPSIEKSSQQHRSTFHLSNFFHTLTKFSRNIRTTNSFVRSTSTNINDIEQLETMINRLKLINQKKSHERFHPTTRYENLTLNCCRDCSGEIHVV